MLGGMNDDLLGQRDETPAASGHWTTTVPARQVALDEVRSEADRDLDRIASEHDARMGLHPPAATIRRVG
jgi:hypothetical protein